MKKKLKFEEIADEFSKIFKQASISRCDYLLIKNKEILFIEVTKFKGKDLSNPQKYSKEVIENVKKMWGSLTVFAWYVSNTKFLEEVEGKRRIYILLIEKFEDRYSRIVSNMLKILKRYKNGGFDDIAFKRK